MKDDRDELSHEYFHQQHVFAMTQKRIVLCVAVEQCATVTCSANVSKGSLHRAEEQWTAEALVVSWLRLQSQTTCNENQSWYVTQYI